MKEVNIGIVGTQFMGQAHSNAWMDVAAFYDLPVKPVMKAACDNIAANLPPFCQRFGWQSQETDWRHLIEREDIDVIDICTSNDVHMPIAVAAAKAGKHVLCEKPFARMADEARQILLTTHNPLVLGGLLLQDDRVRLFTVSRTNTGRTAVRRIVVDDDLLEKARQGWTLSRLWVMGHLGGVPDV